MSSLPDSNKLSPKPIASVANNWVYRPVERNDERMLYLDANEGPEWFEGKNRYPSTATLQSKLAQTYGVDDEQIVIGSGADDMIDRIVRAYLDDTRQMTIAVPTFEMIPKYASLIGSTVNRVPWEQTYPKEAILEASKDTAGVIAIVSPNNPTGEVVPFETVEQIANARPDSVILLDLAYVEFAATDPTTNALGLSNVICVRTFSKAFGLAGARVGYAIGQSELVAPLRIVGSPYPVSTRSIDDALAALEKRDAVVAAAKRSTARAKKIGDLLDRFQVVCRSSDANFVFAPGKRATFLGAALEQQNIRCRRFKNAIRITAPDEQDLDRLTCAIEQSFEPQALLFDMDGVLVDVRSSYRRAIIETCAAFGLNVDHDTIEEVKENGDSNDDWMLTFRLLESCGIKTTLGDVTAEFERRYQGGLWENESALVDSSRLRSLKTTYKLAVVTGRPRGDAERAIAQFGWEEVFDAVICREDAPLKPNPEPVERAMQTLDAQSAWFFGDTIDDINSGRDAGVLPIGIDKVDTAIRFRNIEEALQWLQELRN